MFNCSLAAETLSGDTSQTAQRQSRGFSAKSGVAGPFHDSVQDEIRSPPLFLLVPEVSFTGNERISFCFSQPDIGLHGEGMVLKLMPERVIKINTFGIPGQDIGEAILGLHMLTVAQRLIVHLGEQAG